MFRKVVAIVSGGASGLGATTASYLVRNGARVVIADLPQTQEKFLKMEASICSDFVDSSCLKFAKVDVTNEGDVSAALDMAEEEFGEQG